MTSSGSRRANRKRILRRIAAGVATLVALAIPWTCLSAAPPSPPQAAADPAQALPAAPAVQAPPVTTRKPAATPQRARNPAPTADAPTALSATKPDFRREQATGSLRPAPRQPDPRAGALGAAERTIGTLPFEAFFAPSVAPVRPEFPAYQPVRADAPAAAAASDRGAGGAAETAPPPRPTPVRVNRVTPVEDPPLMSPLRWLFVAWGGALALGSAIRMLF
jgi:hypothetical protein